MTTQPYFSAVVLAQSEEIPDAVCSRNGLMCCNDLKLYPKKKERLTVIISVY